MKSLKIIGITTILLGAIATLGILFSTTSFAGSLSDILFTLGFYVWVMLPFIVLFLLTSFINRKNLSPAARIAIIITSILVVLLSVMIYWVSIFHSDSSTSALVFVVIPFYALAATGVLYLFSWLLIRIFMPKSKI